MKNTPAPDFDLKRILPILSWLPNYRREFLYGDINAGIIVAIVLIPQSMAYAMLAGLPPQIGLYSCLLPIIVYGFLGSSRSLAVGPVGLISLVVGSTIVERGLLGQQQAITVAVTLALMSGVLLLLMRLIRLGSIINFISHPVLSGFTSAAALLIAFSQVKHLLGLEIPRTMHIHDTLTNIIAALGDINPMTAILGLSSITLIILSRSHFISNSISTRLPTLAADIATRSGPLIAVVLGIVLVSLFSLDKSASVKIVGIIPAGLPMLSIPSIDFEFIKDLFPVALLVSIVGYLESVSVSKVLASRKRQRVDADQELLAHGAANIASAISGGYPTAGGFGRSMVNFTSGASTPLASFVTVALMTLSLLFLTPLFYYLPNAILAAIIIASVAGLVDYKTFKYAMSYDKADAISLIVTFFIVLTIGIEIGILIGACISIALYLHRSSKPHIAVVGRLGKSEHFRNINRHNVITCSHVVAMRVDENLFFSNTNFLEDSIINLIAEYQQAKHLILVCSAVNYIDTSALEALDSIVEQLQIAGVTLHLSDVKGPVMDGLKKTPFLEKIKPGRIFISTHEAMTELGCN